MRTAIAIVTSILLLSPVIAHAQTKPRTIDMIEVRALRDSSGNGSIDWWLDASGEVRLATIRCVRCHVPNRQYRTFTIAPEDAVRLLARLPESDIEAALRAPCTLPTAISGWAQRVDLNYSFSGSGGSFTGYFGNCRSPLLDRIDGTLREVGEALIALEPPATPEE